MNYFPVERGVPFPEKHHHRGPMYTRRPWDALEVGDSFFVPGGQFNSEHWCAQEAGKRRDGHTFAARVVEGGVRVWRRT